MATTRCGQASSPLLDAACLLPMQQHEGLLFRPYAEVALIIDEYEGRLTVVCADGTVAHRPGPLSEVPVPGLQSLAEGVLASARHGRRHGAWLRYPAGWTYPAVSLARRSPLPVPQSHVITLGHRDIELLDLRALIGEAHGCRVLLADGTSFHLDSQVRKLLPGILGLSADHLEPLSEKHRHMYRLGLRDFPYILLDTSARELRRVFGTDARRCIANLIWEDVRHRARGAPLDYGTEHRGFYYRPVAAVLPRLGVQLTADDVPPPDFPLESVLDACDNDTVGLLNDVSYLLYDRVLADMVGDARLITLKDLGFVNSRPDQSALGTHRPQVLVVAEKASLIPETHQLAADFGVSFVVMGGMAKWEAVEPVADMLGPVLQGRPVDIVTYGDYDPAGWVVDDVCVDMLARYDISATIVGRLVLPKRFTAKEIALLAEPLSTAGGAGKLLHDWMARTHGINNRPLGMHADHLRPYERVKKAFEEETGLAPV